MRSWVVTFLTFAALDSGDGSDIVTPAPVAMCLGLVGTMTSVAGNEAARRFGRVKYITFVMLVSAVLPRLLNLGEGVDTGSPQFSDCSAQALSGQIPRL